MKRAGDISLEKVVNYYSEKVKNFGPTHKGVDWSSVESQELRFQKLAEILVPVQSADKTTILDFGCGYGAFFQYLKKNFPEIFYQGIGFDLSKQMLQEAQRINSDATWMDTLPDGATYDYVIASGVFNVKLEAPEAEWKQYVFSTLEKLDNLARKGFAFNLLTSFSDRDKMVPHLFYADPSEYFVFCKQKFSKYVSLLHDYPLYEFTILVRKQL